MKHSTEEAVHILPRHGHLGINTLHTIPVHGETGTEITMVCGSCAESLMYEQHSPETELVQDVLRCLSWQDVFAYLASLL